MRWLDKLTDAASENFHVVRQAPWAFGICLLALLIPICALIYWIDDARMDAKYSGTIASKDALIAHLENQLSTRPLPTSGIATLSTTPIPHGQDDISQSGRRAGVGTGVIADLTDNSLMYKRFVVDGRFDATRDFEYRDYVLHLEKADFHTFIVGGVGVRKEAENARAKIVARR